MPNFIRPISISDFPANAYTNCLGFAVGYTDAMTNVDQFNLDEHFPIAESFERKLIELGYERLPRRIQEVSEAHDGEYVIMVFDFTPYRVKDFFLREWVTHMDFHVARREPDGTWVHKPGWKDKPCEIRTEADWEAIFNEFGRKYVLFALAV